MTRKAFLTGLMLAASTVMLAAQTRVAGIDIDFVAISVDLHAAAAIDLQRLQRGGAAAQLEPGVRRALVEHAVALTTFPELA